MIQVIAVDSSNTHNATERRASIQALGGIEITFHPHNISNFKPTLDTLTAIDDHVFNFARRISFNREFRVLAILGPSRNGHEVRRRGQVAIKWCQIITRNRVYLVLLEISTNSRHRTLVQQGRQLELVLSTASHSSNSCHLGLAIELASLIEVCTHQHNIADLKSGCNFIRRLIIRLAIGVSGPTINAWTVGRQRKRAVIRANIFTCNVLDLVTFHVQALSHNTIRLQNAGEVKRIDVWKVSSNAQHLRTTIHIPAFVIMQLHLHKIVLFEAPWEYPGFFIRL